MPYKLVAIQDNVYSYDDKRQARHKEQIFYSKDEVISILESLAYAIDDALPNDSDYCSYGNHPVADALRRAIDMANENDFLD